MKFEEGFAGGYSEVCELADYCMCAKKEKAASVLRKVARHMSNWRTFPRSPGVSDPYGVGQRCCTSCVWAQCG